MSLFRKGPISSAGYAGSVIGPVSLFAVSAGFLAPVAVALFAAAGTGAEGAGASALRFARLFVITSYSIHYTKLYDPF